MRPQLTEEQAARYSRDEVLRYTGAAGNDVTDPWLPAPLVATAILLDFTVGQGGSHATVQQAVNAALVQGRGGRVAIGIMPGVHEGLVYVPPAPFALTLIGLGRRADDVMLLSNIDAEMPGPEYRRRFQAQFADAPAQVASIFRRIAATDRITTANASVVRVENNDFQLLNLTIRNSYGADRVQPDSTETNAAGQFRKGQHQAVALLIAGADRVQVQDVALRSFQDTLYLQSPARGRTVRTCLTGCDIEGDVDFIFGQSTAWFERCQIRSLGTRAPQAWATAPSTDICTRHGFVFNDCDFTHDGSPAALAGRFSLGRQWFEGVRATPYGQPTVPGYRCDLGAVSGYDPPSGTISRATLQSVGKCVILRSRIGAHINRAAPWDDWNGNSWNPRYRPAQYRASDMLDALSGWLRGQDITFEDVDPAMVFLGEYDNQNS
ncbi:pectinesterase family protein [Paracoccus tegillarcae]|uniref:Pectinesterase n=1 Tax=Paracoccus tegillarcae TaxID=1529068 RepID=A0A2K9F5A2_9RHOB|nr:pectinesterase family protein [Paracoccus tegillarcae]AUH34351.1 hypothetical protein CUV01_14015 [Paracoccus tegillarcae]